VATTSETVVGELAPGRGDDRGVAGEQAVIGQPGQRQRVTTPAEDHAGGGRSDHPCGLADLPCSVESIGDDRRYRGNEPRSEPVGAVRVVAEQTEEAHVSAGSAEQARGEAAAETGREQVLGPRPHFRERNWYVGGQHRRSGAAEAQLLHLGVGIRGEEVAAERLGRPRGGQGRVPALLGVATASQAASNGTTPPSTSRTFCARSCSVVAVAPLSASSR
jgi:hypothetical protein